MGLIQSIRDRYITKPIADVILKSLTPELPSIANPDNSAVGLQTFAVPVGFNNQMATYNKRMVSSGGVDWSTLRSISVNHETTRAAINVRKREIIQLGFDVVDVNDDSNSSASAAERNRAKELITNIGGDGVRFREILDKLIEDTLVLDACVFYKQRTRDGKLLRIVPIDGATIKLRVDEAGMTPLAPEIAYEQWIRGQKTAELTTEDLSYEMMNPRSDNPYGLSPLESLIITLDSSMRAMLYNLSYLSDNNVPQGFINAPEEWKIQQFKEYSEFLESAISGPKKTSRLFLIPARAKYQPTSKPQDFAFKDFFDYLDRKVCMMFDVTPQELGLSLQQYKENAEGQDKIQIRKGIKPLANFLQEILTDLLRDELGYPNFAFKFTGLDFRFSLDEAKTLVPLGILGIDEYRNDMGLDKKDVDNFVIAGNTVIPVDQIEDQAQATTDNMQNPPTPNVSQEKIGVSAEDKTPTPQPKKKVEEPSVTKIARNVGLEALEKSAKYKSFHTKVKSAITRQLQPFTKEANLDKDIESVMPSFKVDGLTSYLDWVMEQAVKRTMDAFKLDKADAIKNPKFKSMLEDRENYLIDSVDNTTKQYIVDQLSQGHAQGLTNAQIAQQISDAVDEISLSRANVITNTETANATQQAELSTYQDQGITKKVWVLSEDIDDECGINASQGAIDVSDNFSSGDDAPPAHPSCRCFLQADISSIEAMDLGSMKKGWVTINGAHVLLNESGEGGAQHDISERGGGIATAERPQGFASMTEPQQLKATEAGQKPLAMLPDFQEQGYQSSSLSHIPITTKQFSIENGKITGVTDFPQNIWYKPANASQAHQLASVMTNIASKWSSVPIGESASMIPQITAAQHTQIGSLLGYTPSEISGFLGRINAKMQKGWITVNGAHVLIGDATGESVMSGGGASVASTGVQMENGHVVSAPGLKEMNQQSVDHIISDLEGKAKMGAEPALPSDIGQKIRSIDFSTARNPLEVGEKILSSLPHEIAGNPNVRATVSDMRMHQMVADSKFGGKPF